MLYQAELRSLPMKRLKNYGNHLKMQALFFREISPCGEPYRIFVRVAIHLKIDPVSLA